MTTDVKSAVAKAAEQSYAEDTMLARAIVALLDGPGEDGQPLDPEALGYVRRRAAAGHPSDALTRFKEERDRQQFEAARHQEFGVSDASREPREVREARYARMFGGGA